MAWAYKASSYADDGAGFSVATGGTATVVLGAACAVGDLISVGIIAQDSAVTPSFSITDNVNSGSYTEDIFQSDGTGWTGYVAHIRQSLFSKVANAAGTPTVTVTMTGSGANIIGGIVAFIHTGTATTTPFDVGHAGNGSGTAASSGATAATGAANELAIGLVGDLGEACTLTALSGTGRGAHQNDGGNWQGGLEDQDSGASGSTVTATFTKGTSTPWGMLVAVYKLAAGAAQDTPELYGRPFGARGQDQFQQLIAT